MTHTYDADILKAKRWAILRLSLKAERTCPQNPTRELTDYLDVECIDSFNLANARCLARYCGATKVGKTRRDALEALAAAWMRYRSLTRSAAISKRCAARVRALELKQRAYASHRSVAAQRERERRESETHRAIARAISDHSYCKNVVIRHTIARGNQWFGSRVVEADLPVEIRELA